LFSGLGLVFYELKLAAKIVRIVFKKDAVLFHNLTVERRVQREDQIAIAQCFEQGGIGPSHTVPMDVTVAVAVKLFYVFAVAHMAQKTNPAVLRSTESIDKRAAIVCISRNGQDPVAAKPLETLYDQVGIVLRHEPTGYQVISKWLQSI